MNIAWATIAILALILPGVFFFIGLSIYERLPREIIRSGVVSEVALAAVVAIFLHTIFISVLSATGFRLNSLITLITSEYSSGMAAPGLTRAISDCLLSVALYLLVTAAVGFALGYLVALGIVTGRLRFLARHKWIYDVIKADRKRAIVTAYVMTKVVLDNKVLMYRGRVHEVFLGNEGAVSYIILRNCSKFYMTFAAQGLVSSDQKELFDHHAQDRIWDYLLIEGENISNILFDPARLRIAETPAGKRALNKQLEELRRLSRDRNIARLAALRARTMERKKPD